MLLSAFLFFGSAFWYLRAIIHGDARPHHLWVGYALFALLALSFAPTRQSAFLVHADAPGLAFAALSMVFALMPGRGYLLLAGICGALSVFSKTPFAPVLVAVPLYVGLFHGWGSILALPLQEIGPIDDEVAVEVAGTRNRCNRLQWISQVI